MNDKIASAPTNIPFKAVFPGKYIQAEKATQLLPELLNLFGKKPLIIASSTSAKRILPSYGIKDDATLSIMRFGGECCEKEIRKILDAITAGKSDVLVGMGGGKTIDAAKIAAHRAGIPVIIVPTIASTDAPCSGCAVIYTDKGEFEAVSYQKTNPQAVLVDSSVIAESPVRFLVAGMGDALATWFEARSCERTNSINCCGGYSTMAGLAIAKLCYDSLFQYGEAAKTACINKVITPALNHIIEANILLSGLGFESSGLAAAHSIHNGLTAIEETHAYYHGEKVAFGVLAGLHLTDASASEMETVYSFCEKIGLPTTLADVGIKSPSKDKLIAVAAKACIPEEGIHHEALIVTPEKVLNAIIAADAMGNKRKKLT